MATLSADWLNSNGAIADTHGMDGRYIEPRQVMWAVTENPTGGRSRSVLSCARYLGRQIEIRGTHSGQAAACHRIEAHYQVAARTMVRSCAELSSGRRRFSAWRTARSRSQAGRQGRTCACAHRSKIAHRRLQNTRQQRCGTPRGFAALDSRIRLAHAIPARSVVAPPARPATAVTASNLSSASHTQGTFLRPERKVMEPKTIYPHFWRRQRDGHPPDEGAPANSKGMEASVAKNNSRIGRNGEGSRALRAAHAVQSRSGR